MFLAMKIDETSANILMQPDRITGVVNLPNLSTDYKSATENGEDYYVVVEMVQKEDLTFDAIYSSMTGTEFFATYKIDELSEFENDWMDVSKI